MSQIVVFTSRSWQDADGDPAKPAKVAGILVHHRICVRLDRPGALVALDDRRYALTGPTLAVGSKDQLLWYLRARWRQAQGAPERAWLDQAAAALRDRGRRFADGDLRRRSPGRMRSRADGVTRRPT